MIIKKIDHFVLTTSQPKVFCQFYQKLGFRWLAQEGRNELFSDSFKINVHTLEHELEPHATKVQPGSADLCFEMEQSMEEIVCWLNDNKIEIALGPVHRFGRFGSMDSVYVYDPEGNLLEFCVYHQKVS